MAVVKPAPKGPSKNSKPKSTFKKPSVRPGPPPKQTKEKRPKVDLRRKKKVYTEKQLDIPTLNMITPVGVQKPKGKKKGKVFVDDAESMLTIMAMVNADKEGQLESKMAKARQLEEIRQARLKEQEVRQEERKSKLVCLARLYMV
jgi:60S ribosomal subunit assembly/export protein LOC1